VAIDLQRSTRVRPVVNVTPLVDVVLVLLIVFMVVAPLLERELGIRLPSTRVGARPPDAAQVVLALDDGGVLRLDGERIALADLPDRLAPLLAARTAPVVFFQAADDVRYGDAVRVLDAARGAGAREIATVLASPPARAPR